jgi:hypothetical protein
MKTPGASFIQSFPFTDIDLILSGEKRPPSFKILLSCLYDESLADLIFDAVFFAVSWLFFVVSFKTPLLQHGLRTLAN